MLRARGEAAEAGRFEAMASSSSLVPRPPHPRQTTPWSCEQVTGPNVVRLKFIEGTAIRIDDDGTFFSDSGPAMTPELQAELDAINTRPGTRRERSFDQSVAELLALEEDAEKETGEEHADMTLWHDILAGESWIEVAANDPEVCAKVTALLDWLNSLAIVEVAEPMSEITLPRFLNPAPAADDPPVTTGVFEPPHMGATSAGGVDSPLYIPELSPDFTPGWRGDNVAVVDIESSGGYGHEKFSVHHFGGGYERNTAEFMRHSTAAMSVVFGTAFSGNVETNPRYGTRGFVPNAHRGFSHSNDWCWIVGYCPDTAEGLLRSAPLTERGDFLMLVVGTRMLWNGFDKAPAEANSDTYDAIRIVSGIGRLTIEPAGNDGRSIDQLLNRRPHSGAIIVGANNAESFPQRAGFSNYGSRVDLNSWGGRVHHANAVLGSEPFQFGAPLMPDTGLFGQQYFNNFNGTSSATPIVTGSLAQYQGVFRQTYGHPMGDPGFGRATALRELAQFWGRYVSEVGYQPEVRATVLHLILATHITTCGTLIRPPHHWDALVTIGSGITSVSAPWAPSQCAFQSSSSSTSGAFVDEEEVGSDRGPIDLGHNPDRSFVIEAHVVIPNATNDWQAIVAKENPRNFGLWVVPSWAGANSGRLHFSYLPEGYPYLCGSTGVRDIADGQPHAVALRFDRRSNGVPTISFFVDGMLDNTVSGCAGTRPVAGGGAGANRLVIGANLVPGGAVGDVRLYHRYESDQEINLHRYF